ncbi:MAG: hypothetical protein J5586_07220 [Clostridia bacterium]|nr:hypothetical protein [Clostridia bacterium]
MENTAGKKGIRRAEALLSAVAALAACAAFALYAHKHAGAYAIRDYLAPAAALLLFVLVFVAAVPRIVRAVTGREELSAPDAAGPWRTFLIICAAALAIHIAAGLAGALMYSSIANFDGGLYAAWRRAWMKTNTDAGHYLTIAENWYVKTGDDRLLIVFFPMLPVLIRGLNLLTHDGFISAQIINAAASSLACGMTYMALRRAVGERRSRAAAFIALLLPGAIFMNSPMTEPLFLLFTACAFYMMQERRWIAAGLFTALAGATRSLGVLAAVPLAFMGACRVISLIREKQKWGGELARLLIGLALSTLGTLAYLGINYSVHGDPFKFLEYQWSNWYQKACPFFDTPRYILDRCIKCVPNDLPKLWSLWLPQMAAIFGSLIIMLFAARRLPAAYTLYFLCYFAVSIGCTWLLSSVRYLSAALPLIAAIALPCEKRWRTAAILAVSTALYAAYMMMYMQRLGIY